MDFNPPLLSYKVSKILRLHFRQDDTKLMDKLYPILCIIQDPNLGLTRPTRATWGPKDHKDIYVSSLETKKGSIQNQIGCFRLGDGTQYTQQVLFKSF